MKPSFAADRSLGKLAKWLRLMGFDTIFEADATGKQFKRLSGSGRILLTRMRRLRGNRPSVSLLWIEANDPWLQVRQVVEHLGLTEGDLDPFSRCLSCNAPIAVMDKAETFGLVPDYIWEIHEVFSRCPCCGRIFWPGSHTRRSRQRLHTLFEGNA